MEYLGGGGMECMKGGGGYLGWGYMGACGLEYQGGGVGAPAPRHLVAQDGGEHSEGMRRHAVQDLKGVEWVGMGDGGT